MMKWMKMCMSKKKGRKLTEELTFSGSHLSHLHRRTVLGDGLGSLIDFF